MEIFEDKAIVDLKKYKKLQEFYEKIPLGWVYIFYNTYGENKFIKFKTESEAVKEVVEYNEKLAKEVNRLNAQVSGLESRIDELNSEKRSLEGRYQKEISDHNYTKNKLTSTKTALTELIKTHNNLLESIKGWSILKFLSERRKKVVKMRFE
jgi:t-SNARE complex subunit (syntaxin)